MEGLARLLDAVRDRTLAPGHLRGLFHVLIGRKIVTPEGAPVSAGVTWRELSALLKDARFDKDLVTELGADPDELSPRDRQRFWYSAIALARPDSPEAVAQAEKLIPLLKAVGFVVQPAVGGAAGRPNAPAAPPPAPSPRPKKKDDHPPPKPKKK